jgi:hypothetical protein
MSSIYSKNTPWCIFVGYFLSFLRSAAVSAFRGWSGEPQKSVEIRWNGIGVVQGWSPPRTGQVCERISAQTPWIHPGPKIRFRFRDSESETNQALCHMLQRRTFHDHAARWCSKQLTRFRNITFLIAISHSIHNGAIFSTQHGTQREKEPA